MPIQQIAKLRILTVSLLISLMALSACAEKKSPEFATLVITEAAYASFEEDIKGKLMPGMLADFVLLDRDLTAIAPQTIRDAKVLKTIVGGNVVFSADL